MAKLQGNPDFELVRQCIDYDTLENSLVSRLVSKYPTLGIGQIRKIASDLAADFDEHLHKEFKMTY